MEYNVIDDIKKEYLYELAKKGKRISGREINRSRELRMETGVINTAEGSARIRLGDTDVLVCVKATTGEPARDEPCKGITTVNCELTPMASPDLEFVASRGNAIELARVVERSIGESETIDLESLCLEEGEKVWILHIDIHVLDYDGNLVDATVLGALCALRDTIIPFSAEREGERDFSLELKHLPVAVTFAKINDRLFLDPDRIEDNICTGRLTICTDENGDIRAMQKSKSGRFTFEEIQRAIDASIERGEEIREFLRITN